MITDPARSIRHWTRAIYCALAVDVAAVFIVVLATR